jgi:hypothetical protein
MEAPLNALPHGRASASVIEVRRLVTLSVDYVINCLLDVTGLPQVARAPVPRPRLGVRGKQTRFTQLPRRVALESIHHAFWPANGCHDYMNVVRSGIYCSKAEVSIFANFTDCLLDGGALCRVQNNRLVFQSHRVGTFEHSIGRDARRAVNIMSAPIHRAAGIAVQPRSVASEGDEIGKRERRAVEVLRHFTSGKTNALPYGRASASV